jgi:hypothetical protein
LERVVAEMSEPSMPELGRRGDHQAMVLGSSGAEWIQFSGGVTSEKNRPRSKILDREAINVKLHSHRIITSQCANRNKVLDQGRANKNIVQLKRSSRSWNGDGADVAHGVHDEILVSDGVADVGECVGEALEAAAVVMDREIALLQAMEIL